LKSGDGDRKVSGRRVTPLAGVWIEILVRSQVYGQRNVTPLAGVWIEIPKIC